MLTGLDEIDWASLEHAYGSAEDTPELLRRVASGNEDDASDALDELWGSIWHQGSVYAATAPAVPHLAEIAAAGSAASAAGVLHLLGAIAESSYPRGAEESNAVHEAVAACYGVIAPLLERTDGEIRAAAMFVLAHSGFPERVRPLIAEHWQLETDPSNRAEALHAMMRVDPVAAAELAEEVLSGDPSDDGELRVSAALAWIRGGRALDERVLAAALAPIPSEAALSNWLEGDYLFNVLVEEIAERLSVKSAIDFTVRALNDSVHRSAEIAKQRLYAVENLVVKYRSAIASLAEPIARFLDNAELARTAVRLHALIDPDMAAPGVRDHVVALARTGESALADEALSCLAKWADRDVLPFNPELLGTIRARLTALIDAGDERPANSLIKGKKYNETVGLTRILVVWGSDAAPAVPELIRLLAIRSTVAAPALVTIQPQDPECLAALRSTAATLKRQQAYGLSRLAVAQAIRDLAKDSEPLLDAVIDGLSDKHVCLEAAQAAAESPEHADVLVPRLREALRAISRPNRNSRDHDARVELARTLWLLTGEADELIQALRDSLEPKGAFRGAWYIVRAAEVATELGPLGRELLPMLEPILGNPVACPAAVQALFAIDPERVWEGADRERLVDHLIHTLTTGSTGRVRGRACDVLADLAPLPPESAERLRRLASEEKRVFAAGQPTERVSFDESTRTRVLALLSR
jgi:hypothetical protein